MNNITDEQFDVITEVHKEHMEEYTLWVKAHGTQYYEEWCTTNTNRDIFSPEFIYHVCSKFMEHRATNV